ncbi:MAG: sigma-70 family RNA polymerase sigma factor [Kofleriaceae bacterium]|nr:sigma-70 family RNA polymerase sigma factor [Myxococcales bacterium]MCB9562473.1 sigma-70 family RNA polymerase sigma factor [Kofleriaceae bacterium]MCB9570768.1 sigma-70 family RNA polymerase sigma factor [Kofleriaceae bacterium]
MDDAALRDLLRRHAGLIHKIAYAYCRDATDREDVIQEIAVQLWRSRDRYDPRFRETTWIYRIALNVAISFHRRERRHRGGEPLDEHLLVVEPVEPGDDVRLLLGCIDALAPLDKALVLLYLDGNDHGSIAEVLGISTSNVGTKLGRIKQRLRAALAAAAHPPEESHGAR